jgi:uncharacterized delta-60 repeat protein
MKPVSTPIVVCLNGANRKSRSALAFGLIVLILCFDTSLVFAGDGVLDHTFGSGGKVITQLSQEPSSGIYAIKVQADGKLIAAGDISNNFAADFAIARYNTGGSLDTSFGIGGVVTTDFLGEQDTALGVAIQNDGKIVAAGYAFSSNASYNFALARYNTDGTLDTTFGSGGRVTTDFFTSDDEAIAIAILTDGKIVAAGLASDIAGVSDFAIARYNADGSLDTSFGANGTVTTDFGGHDAAQSLAIQADGKVVTAGSIANASNYDFALARYHTDGTLDSGFGIGGKVTTDFFGTNDEVLGIVIQSDNKIVAVGGSPGGPETNPDFILARYNTDGSLDNTFGNGGKVSTDFFGEYDRATAVAIQTDQSIVVTGMVAGANTAFFGLARYDSNGSLDPNFGDGGKVTTDFSTPAAANSLVIQSDNKIVVAGTAGGHFALARYKVAKRSRPVK